MHSILLDNVEVVVVPDTAFAKIRALLSQSRICKLCEKSFDDKTNPMVAENICLSCFLRENSGLHLTLSSTKKQENGVTTSQFLDADGFIYTASSLSDSSEAYESIPLTLAYWQFPDMATVTLEGKQVELDDIDASIYGDIQTNSVVVISKRKKGGRLEVTFLSYKNGKCVYLDKAKGKTRKIWREAESQYLATKDARGRYHYKDRISRQPFQSDIYCLLSDNESATYDKERKAGIEEKKGKEEEDA